MLNSLISVKTEWKYFWGYISLERRRKKKRDFLIWGILWAQVRDPMHSTWNTGANIPAKQRHRSSSNNSFLFSLFLLYPLLIYLLLFFSNKPTTLLDYNLGKSLEANARNIFVQWVIHYVLEDILRYLLRLRKSCLEIVKNFFLDCNISDQTLQV